MMTRIALVTVCTLAVISGIAPARPVILTPLELVGSAPLLFEGRVASVEDGVAVFDVLHTYRGQVGERVRVSEIPRGWEHSAVRFVIGERWLLGLSDDGRLRYNEYSRLLIDTDANIADTIRSFMAIADSNPGNDGDAERHLAKKIEDPDCLAEIELLFFLEIVAQRKRVMMSSESTLGLIQTALSLPVREPRDGSVALRGYHSVHYWAIIGLRRSGHTEHFAQTLAFGLESDYHYIRNGCHFALEQYTGRDFGYDAMKPLEGQEAAIRAWKEWAASVTDLPPIEPPR